MGVVEQLTALAEPAMHPGEEVLGAVRVNYNGTMQPNATSMNASFGASADAFSTSLSAPAVTCSASVSTSDASATRSADA